VRPEVEGVDLSLRQVVPTRDIALLPGRRIESIAAEDLTALTPYSWPGNIRELQNVIERAVLLASGPVLHVRLGDEQRAAPAQPGAAPVTLADAEREHILSALREARWVLGGPNGAAQRLGMKRSSGWHCGAPTRSW
jgi:formate hydrogenlyase transcriptional activator